jgi:WD40 repeat protein
MAALQRQGLSPDNPWPGLDPFDEADRKYFHGREAESGELLRLVRRELLTVLFGRSGLGKSSLLKAGLFPLLRGEDGLPVYVRLDHGEGAPALREQVLAALRAACDADRVQASRPAADETLWSFFHRRDAEFWSARNRPVTPVVVFDQFEEIFTLGQASEASQARSAAFLVELGDLVENRPPEAVRAALEAEPGAARRFDFKRSTAKLVLSFREDFLAEMEGLKERMPSLMYNRFRLLAMSGAQAYDVVTCAGGQLVDDDVARRIIRLAWKNEPSPPVEPAEFPKIEIDPALLSVVCSELNHKRRQAEPPLARITPALLEGADREILSGFYERGMAGLDPRVRAFVEDELITDRGFRDSHALEDALALPGVTAEALDALIRRRLLRVDERQSVRRLELTHDVLARVVKESRDHRRAREAEEAAAAREREALAQQRRNRRIGWFVVATAVVMIVLAGLAGWFALQVRDERRRAAELLTAAEGTRLVATADRLQENDYDASLLVNMEALGVAPTLDAQAGLLRRFVSHPHLAAFLPAAEEALAVAFSPDGKRLAAAGGDQTVVLWDVDGRRPAATLAGHDDAVVGVAFSPDGKRLASASRDGHVVLWDVDRREPTASLAEHTDVVSGVAFSPDGQRLASGSRDKTVILWDVESGQRLATLARHQAAVKSVAFSPDGKRLASASDDQTAMLWDVDSRRPLATLRGHAGPISSVAFSPDGRRLATASWDEDVIVWDVDSGEALASLAGHKAAVVGVAFSPDGKRLASASRDWTAILWDVDSRQLLASLEGHRNEVTGVAFSPDGRRLATASLDRSLILWEVNRHQARTTLRGHEGTVYGVVFSPDGKRLASASEDRTVTLWDVDARTPAATLKGHQDTVIGLAFSPDGGRLASVSADKTVIVWDPDGRRPPVTLRGHAAEVYGVTAGPDGLLASAGEDKTVIVWDVDGRRPRARLEGHGGAIYDVAVSPDGKRLASASRDKTVILWDVAGPRPPAKLEGHKDAAEGVAFSPDGRRVASGSGDETVILWDAEGREPPATLRGHQDAVFGVAFSPDGKRLASASWDRTVILWDVESRKPLATLGGHQGGVFGVAFSPDGKRLASASEDRTVILWDLDPDVLTAAACRTANRNLTCEEWRNYIGADKPYRKTCAGLPGPGRCD